jgi:RNA polymerase sigma-70 factor (ECF subfamily)
MLRLVVSSGPNQPPAGGRPPWTGADDDGFEKVFARYARYVAVVVRGVLGDVPEVEDVVQETFVNALLHWETCRGDRKGWLAAIARNAASSRGRAVAVRNAAAKEIARSLEGEAEPVEHGRDLERLGDAFDGLSVDDADLLKRRYVLGQKHEEIATDIGRPPASVRRQVPEAFARLKDLFFTKKGPR